MKQIFISALHKTYKLLIAPFIGDCCRFHPSCSDYAKEALTNHGFFRGGILTIYRLIRCNPLSKGWFDPVPEKKVLFQINSVKVSKNAR